METDLLVQRSFSEFCCKFEIQTYVQNSKNWYANIWLMSAVLCCCQEAERRHQEDVEKVEQEKTDLQAKLEDMVKQEEGLHAQVSGGHSVTLVSGGRGVIVSYWSMGS